MNGQVFGIWLTMADGTAAWATTTDGRLIVADTAEAIASDFPALGEPRVIPDPIDVRVWASREYCATGDEPAGKKLKLSIGATSE